MHSSIASMILSLMMIGGGMLMATTSIPICTAATSSTKYTVFLTSPPSRPVNHMNIFGVPRGGVQELSISSEDANTNVGKGGDEGANKEEDNNNNVAVSQKMYNKQATNWVRTKPRCLSDFTGRPVIFSMLEKYTQNATILDIGCGEGYCARKLVNDMGARHVIGCDISEEMIQRAIETAKSHGNSEKFTYFTSPCSQLLERLNEKVTTIENTMDVAIAVFLFNYLKIDEMNNCIDQAYKALKPDGIFVFSVPHPSMIFTHCHDHDGGDNNEKESIFNIESKGKGYFSSRNEKLLGYISTIDGERLNIMSVHKTLNDYISAINRAGFRILDIQEAGVKEEHLKMNPDFFESVKDRPLHLIFKLKKE